MNDDDIRRQLKKYSNLISFFPTIIISDDMISDIKANTIYISCQFKDPIESSFDIEYTISNSIEGEYGDKPNNINGIHIFSEKSKGRSKRSGKIYIGTFLPEFNSLTLERNIFSEKNSEDIIKSIVGIINKIRNQEKELFKRKIVLDKKIQIIFGNKIYNHQVTDIVNRKLWHLKELLFCSGKHSLVIFGNSVFKLGKYRSSDLVQEYKIDEIAERAMKAIDEIKRNYVNQLNKIKETYVKKFEENIPIPNISLENILDNKLMISRYDKGVIYSFVVDIKVDVALNEDRQEYVKLEPPYVYKNNILIFYINTNNKLEKIKLYDETGKNCSKHLQITCDDEVCTGSLKVIGKKFDNIKQILELKNKMVVLLSTFNTDSCRHIYPYNEVCDKIYNSGLRIKGEQGIVFKQKNEDNLGEMIHSVSEE